jgi:hypothetical protein
MMASGSGPNLCSQTPAYLRKCFLLGPVAITSGIIWPWCFVARLCGRVYRQTDPPWTASLPSIVWKESKWQSANNKDWHLVRRDYIVAAHAQKSIFVYGAERTSTYSRTTNTRITHVHIDKDIRL